MVSPKKFTSSSRLYSSQNHHDNLDITRLDVDTSSSLNFNLDGSLCLSKRSDRKDDINTSSVATEDSGSYLQVIVKKHHTRKEPIAEVSVGAQTSPVEASSPKQKDDCDPMKEKAAIFTKYDAKNPGIYMVPHPMLLSYQFPQKTHLVDAATSISPPVATKQKLAESLKLQYENGKNDGKKFDGFRNIFKGTPILTPETKKIEKTEVYYFESSAQAAFLASTDAAPVTRSDACNARAERFATRVWAEVFSPLYMLLSFMTVFVIQLQRFILVGIYRPLLIDSIQTWSDYGLKPALTLVYNALIRPLLLLLQNVFTTLQETLRPLARLFADCMRPVNNLVRSFRLVNVSKKSSRVRNA